RACCRFSWRRPASRSRAPPGPMIRRCSRRPGNSRSKQRNSPPRRRLPNVAARERRLRSWCSSVPACRWSCCAIRWPACTLQGPRWPRRVPRSASRARRPNWRVLPAPIHRTAASATCPGSWCSVAASSWRPRAVSSAESACRARRAANSMRTAHARASRRSPTCSSSAEPGPEMLPTWSRLPPFALAWLLALACLLPGPVTASELFESVGVSIEPVRVTDRVYYVRGRAGMVSKENEGFNSNAGFVVTDDGVVVFDALGTPALGAALLGVIRGVTDQPVRRVIVSHYHSDHFYGVQAFKAAGAEIW